MSSVEHHISGELARRAQLALARLASCTSCPRRCQVNRLEDEQGECLTGRHARVSSVGPHFGEEPPLTGQRGSGTIFFSGCNLSCAFCQNAAISQRHTGQVLEPHELAEAMLSIQSMGCHNINLVSPSHVVPQILEALDLAAARGLTLPVVYNSGGYDALQTLALLDGVVDIYMPDLKYMDAEVGQRLSGVEDYPDVAQAALRAMHQQVGDLEVDAQGVAVRGMIVRHLVLPQGLAGTDKAVRFIADEISRDTYLNIMDQYSPCYMVRSDPVMGRCITLKEYMAARTLALAAGLTRLPP